LPASDDNLVSTAEVDPVVADGTVLLDTIPNDSPLDPNGEDADAFPNGFEREARGNSFDVASLFPSFVALRLPNKDGAEFEVPAPNVFDPPNSEGVAKGCALAFSLEFADGFAPVPLNLLTAPNPAKEDPCVAVGRRL
jgi:hypothetical protein